MKNKEGVRMTYDQCIKELEVGGRVSCNSWQEFNKDKNYWVNTSWVYMTEDGVIRKHNNDGSDETLDPDYLRRFCASSELIGESLMYKLDIQK